MKFTLDSLLFFTKILSKSQYTHDHFFGKCIQNIIENRTTLMVKSDIFVHFVNQIYAKISIQNRKNRGKRENYADTKSRK